jgi:hypothetical protein
VSRHRTFGQVGQLLGAELLSLSPHQLTHNAKNGPGGGTEVDIGEGHPRRFSTPMPLTVQTLLTANHPMAVTIAVPIPGATQWWSLTFCMKVAGVSDSA